MPDWLHAIILGLIEGITEFIPVSSTGHLLIVEKLGWVPEEGELFNVVIQVGAALALLPVFWRKLTGLVCGLGDRANRDLLAKLAVAFVITAVGGLIMKKMGATLDKQSLSAVAWATLVGGFVILGVETWCKRLRPSNEITWLLAVAFGLAQLVAMAFPGASRSGTTIMLAMALGMARPAATEFSFLLGIPTLFAAGGKEMFDALKHHTGLPVSWSHLAIGFAAAAVSAFVVVKWLIRYVQNHTFNGFAIYRLAVGAALLFWIAKHAGAA